MTEEQLFHAALAKSPTERAAFLDQACSGNAPLRAAVEALLAAHEAPGSFLNPNPNPPAANPPDSNLAATLDSGVAADGNHAASGEHLSSSARARGTRPPQTETTDYRRDAVAGVVIGGRYTLQEKIGEGGMGEVWVAKQTEPVKRKVALKLIKTGMDSRAVLQRFEQERQALALMDHPNIARVLDGGMTPTGQPFFVMELVNGLPLNKFCDEAKLTPKARLELFVPICQAVQHAHQKGIVHRDLKPANLLVTMIDGKPVPKVIDFGVAKATSGKLTEETMSTGFGAVVGTLEYMSPEQAGFSGEDIDTRADIYSLGVILYELLTGLRPTDAKRLRKAAFTEMIRIIQEEEPSKPSTRLSTDEALPSLAAVRQTEPRKLMSLLRGELDWVVMKCLEKQRDRRYETVNALVRDVQRYLADEMVEARPPSAGYRLKKFIRRHKGQVIAANLIVFALLAGMAGTTWGWFEAQKQKKEAERHEQIALAETAKKEEARQAEAETAVRERQAKEDAQAARDQEAKERGYAEAIAQFVKDDFLALTSVEGQREHQGEGLNRDATLRDLLNRAAKKLGERKDLDPRTEAELNWIIGVSYRATGDAALAIPFLERGVELRQQVLGKDALLTLAVQNSLAMAYSSAGHYDKAQRLYEETLELRKAKLGLNHEDTLSSMHALAAFYIRAWKEDLALPLIEETLTRRKATLGVDHADTLASMEILAAVHQSKGNLKLAVTIMEEALRVASAKFAPTDHVLVSVKSRLASAYMHAGKPDLSVPILEEELKVLQDTLESDHPHTRTAMTNLATAYEEAGKLDLALPLFEEALRSARDKYGPNHPSTLISMSNLGRAYAAADQLDRALPLLEESYKLHKARFGPSHPDTFTSMNNLGVAYLGHETNAPDLLAKNSERAVSIFEEVFELVKVRLGPTHPDTIQCMNNLFMAYRQAGKKEAAIAIAEDSVRLMKTYLGPDHPRTLKVMNNLALTYADARKVDQALSLLKETVKLSQAKLGPDHLDTMSCQLNLAMAYRDAGEHDKALPLFEESYNQLRLALGPDHFRTLASMHYLGETLLRNGKLDRAVPLLDEEVRLKSAKFGPDHRDTMEAMNSVGVTYFISKQFEKSVPLFEELLKIQTAKFGKDHPETFRTVANLAVNYKNSGRPADALPLFEEAHRGVKKYPELMQYPQFRNVGRTLLESYAQSNNRIAASNLLIEILPDARIQLPKDSPQLAGMLAQICMGLLDQKKWAEAEPLLRECLAIREKEQPDVWSTFNTQSQLGGALLGQKKYAEAEPLLLAGYEGMKQRESTLPEQGKPRLPEAVDRLIELYTDTDKPDDVQKWQAERAKYPPPAASATEKK